MNHQNIPQVPPPNLTEEEDYIVEKLQGKAKTRRIDVNKLVNAKASWIMNPGTPVELYTELDETFEQWQARKITESQENGKDN